MTFEVAESRPECLLLVCRGDMSWEDREVLAGAVEERLGGDTPVKGVVMDLREVEHINSAGLGALFQIVQRLRGRGGQLALARPKPTIARLFRVTGLDRVAIVKEDVNGAVRAVTETPPDTSASDDDKTD